MSVRFTEVNREEALRLIEAQRNWLASLPAQLKSAPLDALSTEQLLSHNLIGGVTAGALGEE